jgi:glycosyltransferase 2 family protein
VSSSDERDAGALLATATARGLLRIRRGFYAAPPGQARVRRATDVLLLAAALLALVGVVASQPPTPLERSFLRFLETLPTWLDPVWASLIGLVGVWAGLMLLAPLVSRRPRIAAEACAAVVLAGVAALVAARIATGDWPGAQATSGLSNELHFPGTRLAMAAALICVANAHVTRPVAATGRCLLALGSLGAVLEGEVSVGGMAAAVLIGVASGAAVRLALGTSAGLPGIGDIAAALDDLGVKAGDLAPAERQTAGVFLVEGSEPGGGALAIKVYGRDAYDNQVLERLWRTLWYRDTGPAVQSLNRAYGAEREALVTLLARNAGTPATEVVTAGATARGDALLVLRLSGRPLESLSADELGDDLLQQSWVAVEQLGAANVAHGQISPSTLRVSDGGVVLVELGGGTVAPDSDERLTDRAQLLATTATVAGTQRAVAAAVREIGPGGVVALLPYLQPAAFAGPLRRAVKAAGLDVDELRAAAAQASGTPVPELAHLRRVTWGSLLQVALLMLAGGAVLSFLGGVDYDEFKTALGDASWGWVVAGVLVAQLPRVSQSVSTLGSIPVRLAFGPVYLLQLAVSYMNLALPTSFARLAVSVRFLQRQGVPPASAITSGTIDSFANNIVQGIMLVLLLAFSKATLTLHLGKPSDSGATDILLLLLGIAAVVIAGAVILGFAERMRAAMRARIAEWWPQVRGTFSTLRGSHKLTQLFLGNVATEVLFAAALGLFAHGLGYPVSLAELLVINLSVSLFSSLIPVPGGIGIVEGGLVVGLASAGMPQASALAAVLLYRFSTFYLPPTWGWFALQWLRRREYL